MSERILSQWIDTMLLGSGWAAVHMVEIQDDRLGIYSDVQQSGIGRYATRDEAILEARHWSETDAIPLVEPSP